MADEEVVQPEEGQGGAAPYAEYLERIPEDLRGEIEPVFKDWDANVTRRFQESSEYRKQWEPYQELGVHHRDPQEVEWALQFYNALENPAAIKEWYEQYAEQNGLTVQQAEQQIAQQAQGDEFQAFDDFGQPDAQQLEQLLAKQLGPLAEQVAALSQAREEQEFQARKQNEEIRIRSELDEIKEKNPDVYNEAGIEGFIHKYINSDPQHAVARAWEDWQAVHAQITTSSLQEKVNNARPAETGGMPDGSAGEIKWKDTARIALEQIRGANGR